MWSTSATKLLITLRGSYNADFEKLKKKGQKSLLWKTILNKMGTENYNFTANQCDEKWRRLLTRFRQVRDASKASGSGGIKWQYYKLMENSMSPKTRQEISLPKSNAFYIFINPFSIYIVSNYVYEIKSRFSYFYKHECIYLLFNTFFS